MEIRDRYYEMIDYFTGGNKRAFAQKVGIAPTVIENVVGARRTNPSFEVIQKTLFAFENVSADWLITGSGPMLKSESFKPLHKADPEIEKINDNKNALEMIRDLARENGALRKEIEDLKKEKEHIRKYGPYRDLAAEP
jgi:transcriptional regulator with XRE-family HTH domain